MLIVSGVPCLKGYIQFFAGVVVGSATTWYLCAKCQRNRKQNEDSMPMEVDEAINRLENESQIDLILSAADNAARVLESLLSSQLEETARASILYAIDVLTSDNTHSSLPVGLTFDDVGQLFSTSCIEDDYMVRDWLMLNYTPNHKAPRRKQKFPTATSFKNASKLRDVFCMPFGQLHSNGYSYLYDVDEAQLDQINQALEGVDEWGWDIFALKEASLGRPLQTLGWHILHRWNLINTLKLDPGKVRNWLIFVEKMYQDNEYHSSTHAADVLQAVHYLVGRGGGAGYLSPLSIFALVFAAVIHDAAHDGLNNLYHQNAGTERALTFNDQSVQENYHAMTIFAAMRSEPRIDILGALPRDSAREVRRLVILMTLGTDMSNHFRHCQDFKSLVGSLGRAREHWCADAQAVDQLCSNLLHAADLSNPCRPFPLAQTWARLVLDEFFLQGDRERAEGLPVSPLCSRDTTLLPASQVGFISFVVLPYFQVLGELLPEVQQGILPLLEANLKQWRVLEGGDGSGMRKSSSAASLSSSGALSPHSPPLSPTLRSLPRAGSRARIHSSLHLPTLAEAAEPPPSPDTPARTRSG